MACFTPKDTVQFSEVYGEGVLLDIVEGRFLQLNKSATHMWGIMLESESLEEAVTKLATVYDADRQTLHAAAQQLLHDLAAQNLITWERP